MEQKPYEYSVVGETERPVQAPGRSLTLVSENHIQYERRPWIGIAWRFASALAFSATIAGILYAFERKGSLDSWEKRGFNTLAILVPSLMSLSLGSLLGLLGAMIRWPLLEKYNPTPQDVSLQSHSRKDR